MEEMSQLLKAQIANHPRYPNLVSAYIDCQKVGRALMINNVSQVGAPPEMASLLEEIGRVKPQTGMALTSQSQIGADPELDHFMESYCEVLTRYKEELSKSLNEATTFLNNMESQLGTLIKNDKNHTHAPDLFMSSLPDEAAGTSEEETSCGEADESSSSAWSGDQDLKRMLLHKYSGYLSSLRKEFLKKRKKGKLPKDARTTLLDWWNNHYRWPYPTDEEKLMLSETTGLHQKQINNWFINQRKRHWKPSEDMRFALVEGAGIGGATVFFDSGGAAAAGHGHGDA